VSIRAKFNLLVAAAMLLAFAASVALVWQLTLGIAREQVRREADLLTEQALSIRRYTQSEIQPLLAGLADSSFHPHSVPSWAAQTVIGGMAEAFPNYAYQEASLNPTNPNDRAADWQANMIHTFAADPKLKEITLEHAAPSGQQFVVAHPIRLTDPACLSCHDTPQNAPRSLVERYGGKNGFGWKLGDVAAIQVVSVPMQVAIARAQHSFVLFASALALVFGMLWILLNIMLDATILRPIRRISDMATQVSLGRTDVPDYKARGSGEIAALAESFRRMRRSLSTAMKLLDEQK
jgi:HAMP domain-containing protein